MSKQDEYDDKIMEGLETRHNTQCNVYGISYDNILKLQKVLRKKGIECNVDVGGLAIYANSKDPRVVSACKKFGTVADPGVSRQIQDILLRKKD